jgi:hypothetical protein
MLAHSEIIAQLLPSRIASRESTAHFIRMAGNDGVCSFTVVVCGDPSV